MIVQANPQSAAFLHASRLLLLLLCAALGACASPTKISAKNRAAIQTVQIVNPSLGARANVYNDSTSIAAVEAATWIGPIATIIATKSVEGHIESGVKRWAVVTKGQEARVLQLVRQSLEKQFVQAGKLRFSDQGPTDARLQFKSLVYGVSHAGNQRFQVTVEALIVMLKDGQEVWKPIFFTATSSSSNTLEEYQRSPQAYAAGLDEAAQKLARSIVAAY